MKEEQGFPPGTSRAASLADGKLTAGLDAEPSAELVKRAIAQIDLGRSTGADGGGKSPYNIYVIAAALLSTLQSQARRVEELEGAVLQAAIWFEEYADHHQAKGALEKASRNLGRANYLRRAAAEGAR